MANVHLVDNCGLSAYDCDSIRPHAYILQIYASPLLEHGAIGIVQRMAHSCRSDSAEPAVSRVICAVPLNIMEFVG